jgi:predicted nucleic acid-binding protein
MDFSSMYKIDKNEKVFIDANILIFLFSPDFVSSREYQVDKYSKILELLITNNNELYINSLVISEFINRCLRIDFEKNFQDRNRTKDFKRDYRDSDSYVKTLRIIKKEIKKFLKLNVKQIHDDFDKVNIIEELDRLDKLDFNDLMIVKSIEIYGLKLLSDDGDFRGRVDVDWYL